MAEHVVVQRDLDAVLVPMGAPIVIPTGTRVRIVHRLGDSITIEVGGNLARVEGKDADALGLKKEEERKQMPAEEAQKRPQEDVEKDAWEALKQCYDPEIPVDIVNLGLVYELALHKRDEGGFRAKVRMTLTAPGCPVAPMIVEDVRSKLLAVPGIVEAEVELVFDPPWDRSKMSDEAKLKLGMF